MIQNEECIKRIIFDLHGVLLGRSEQLLEREKVTHTINKLRELGIDIFFLTNSSSSSKEKIVSDLANIGIIAQAKEVWSAGHITASYLNQHYKNKKVFLIGKKGFKDILKKYCKEILFEDTSDVDVVVVANSPQLSQEEIEKAKLASNKGACLIGTSYDAVVPAGNKALIGPRACIQKIEKAMSQKALIVGKPNPYSFFHVLELTNKDALETMIIGDSLDTDIKWGKAIGAQTVLLLEKGTALRTKHLDRLNVNHVTNSIDSILSILHKVNKITKW